MQLYGVALRDTVHFDHVTSYFLLYPLLYGVALSDSVYIYHIAEDKWKKGPIPPKTVTECLFEAVYLNGTMFTLDWIHIEAIFEDRSKIFKFNMDSKCWTEESPVNVEWNINSLAFMTGLDNSLFFVSDDSNRNDSIAEYNLETKQWTYYALNLNWGVDTGFSLNGYLYLFSNNQGREDWQTEIFQYDPKDKTCAHIRNLPCYVAHSRAVPMLLPR